MKLRNLVVPSVVLTAALLAAPVSAAGGDPQDGTTFKPVRAVVQPPQKIFNGHRADKLLALETNVRPRDVKMIETTVARNARYQFGWQQKTGKRFADALGPERYAAWTHGQPIQLYSPAVIDEANRMAGLATDHGTGGLERVAINP